MPQNAQARVRQLIERLEELPNEVLLFVDQGAAGRAAALSRITEAPLAPVSGVVGNERRALVKRAEDLVVGALALAIALPVMALVALAIKLDSPGPLFFRQRRHGFNNEEILVWKFRSMRHGSDKSGGSQQIRYDDDRVTCDRPHHPPHQPRRSFCRTALQRAEGRRCRQGGGRRPACAQGEGLARPRKRQAGRPATRTCHLDEARHDPAGLRSRARAVRWTRRSW